MTEKERSERETLMEVHNNLSMAIAKLEPFGEEIKKTDAEIDELVYKIYGITADEKKVIEESTK